MNTAVKAVPDRTDDRPENLWLNLICNVALPVFILMKLSPEDRLGPTLGLILALSLPLGYGLFDFVRRRKYNVFSILGFCSILLTGGLGLLKVDGFWFAVKEAAIPLVLGLAVLASLRTRYPLVRTFLYNDKIIDIERVSGALSERSQLPAFNRLLTQATCLLAGSFFLSAGLNFGLARFFLQSPSGTAEFNAELGRMTAWSWPVIVIPSMLVMMFALWRLLSGIRQLTGLEYEAIFKSGGERQT
jgi:hypothetical protein